MDFNDTRQMPSCPGGFLYRIRPGDTYFQIAQRFGTTIDALVAANPGVDPGNLIIGQVICIPVTPPPGPCPGGFPYVIRSGDTIFALSRRFGVTVEAIVRANPGIDPERLRIGQVICIPSPGQPPCPGGTIYQVRAGDTLFLIAQRFGVSLNSLINANPQISDPNVIQVGDLICIPPR